MSTIVKKQPMDRVRECLLAAVFALAVPSIAFADGDLSVQVPPGATTQLKLCVSRPDPNDVDPIIVNQLGPDFGALGATLLGPPDAAGSAVIDGDSMVIRTVSPLDPTGLPADPTVAVTVAVSDQATTGATVNLTTLGGATLSVLDPSGSSCQSNAGPIGSTVPGAVSITDVQPGSGLLPAGSSITVAGTGFQPGAQVLIDGVSVASIAWVDSTHLEVVTAADVQLDGKLVSVTNPDLTGANFSTPLRATDLGPSARPLLAATQAIFPAGARTSAVFTTPASGTFFGLALQNPGPADAIVSIDLLEAGAVVASATLALPANTKVSREVSELFPGIVPSGGNVFGLTATVPVQMMGLSGNETDGSVIPVLPAISSP